MRRSENIIGRVELALEAAARDHRGLGQRAELNCGADCMESYLFNTPVTLTAVANSTTSDFGGWNGGGCTGTAPCTVTMSQAQTVTATFNLKQYTAGGEDRRWVRHGDRQRALRHGLRGPVGHGVARHRDLPDRRGCDLELAAVDVHRLGRRRLYR
ncbi:MAG: hypothetical protein H0T46_26085, partial [Deltaproteobacteria bacterium]|nr:hypothetical protein [Deltaproteobacteria bacterium]